VTSIGVIHWDTLFVERAGKDNRRHAGDLPRRHARRRWPRTNRAAGHTLSEKNNPRVTDQVNLGAVQARITST
jgi:hypothetical protein